MIVGGGLLAMIWAFGFVHQTYFFKLILSAYDQGAIFLLIFGLQGAVARLSNFFQRHLAFYPLAVWKNPGRVAMRGPVSTQ